MTMLSAVMGSIVERLYRAIPPRPGATAIASGDQDLRCSIAAINFEQGRLDEAAAGLEASLAADPRQPEARYLLGRIREEQGDNGAAEREYRRAIRLNSGRLMYHLRLGGVLEKKGDPGGAVKEYRSAVAACPEDAEARFRLGVALDGLGMLNEAIGEYKAAMRIDPGFQDASVCLHAAVKRKKALRK